MTHLLDTSALLAHYLAESGSAQVHALLENDSLSVGTSILVLFEFDLRLHQFGLDKATRLTEVNRYRALMSEIVEVDEAVRSEAVHLRTSAGSRVAAMDVLIAATASLRNAS